MKSEAVKYTKEWSLLLVGNNPIEMGAMVEKSQQLPGKVKVEIAFDLFSIQDRLAHFKPDFVLIDDNVGHEHLQEIIAALASHRKTKHLPITVLKNSNYRESSAGYAVIDYILKQNFTTEALYHTLTNLLKFRRTQAFLRSTYSKRKRVFQ